MSIDNALLPAGFEVLEPFTARWAIDGAANRAQRRIETSAADLTAFYSVAKDIVANALEYLDRKPIDQFDERDKRLMNMVLSLCHVSLAVEVQGDDEPKLGRALRHMRITRASADREIR